MAELAARARAGAAIWRRLVGARIRSDLQYRTSFVIYLIGQAFASGLDFVVIVVIFGQIDALGGWSLEEVALLYAMSSTSFAIADIFVSQVERISGHIKAGTFDAFLVRPVSPLLQICGSEFALRRVGRVIQPLVVMAIALPRVDVVWDLGRVALVPVAVLCGTVIFGCIWVITSSIAFWTVETQEIANSFTYGGVTLAEYPIDVFASWLRRIVVFVIPIAFVGYLPLAWILGKPSPAGVPTATAWLSPLIAAALVAATRWVWIQAIRHHRSTGS